MKKMLHSFFFGLIFFLLIPKQVLATGLGLYFPFTYGSANFDDFEVDERHFGIGFIMDGNVAKDNIFNYRLNIGLEYFEHAIYQGEYNSVLDYWEYFDYEGEQWRLAVDNTFGIGFLRSRYVRWWMGPQIRLGFIFGDRSGFTLGGGITALGLNFNLGPVFSLSLEGGYRLALNVFFSELDTETNTREFSGEKSANNEGYVKLSFIFRIRDNFKKIY